MFSCYCCIATVHVSVRNELPIRHIKDIAKKLWSLGKNGAVLAFDENKASISKNRNVQTCKRMPKVFIIKTRRKS